MYACVIWDCDVGLLEDRLTDGDFCYFHGGMGGGSLPPPPRTPTKFAFFNSFSNGKGILLF